MRQQIAQETFPNELEGLVPLPRAAALPVCLARQRLVWWGTRSPRGAEEQRWVWRWKGFLWPSAPLCQRGQAVKEGMLSLPEELAMGDAAGEHRAAYDGGLRLVAKLLGMQLFPLIVCFIPVSVLAWCRERWTKQRGAGAGGCL